MTIHRTRRSALGLLGVSAVSGVAFAGAARGDSGSDGTNASKSGHGQIPDELKPGGEFDRFVADLAAKDEFSGTVLLTYRGRTVLGRAYRMADKKRQVPNRPDTIFCLASNTKMFTGVAIHQLAQQGKLAYHEKLGTYLDGFAPDIADNVTVHQLLTHTSGLGDYHQLEGFVEESRTWHRVEQVWDGVMSYVRKDKLTFQPGAGSAYSNTGYAVLGAIVAELSGQPYYDYVREHIFAPAGMASSDFYTRRRWRADRRIAHPYATTPSGDRVDRIGAHLFVGTPAGGSFANTADMARFADALQDNRLLDPAFTTLMLSPKHPIGPSSSESGASVAHSFVGYGSLVGLDDGKWVFGHGGGAPGVSANIMWFPDSRWVFVAHGNYDKAAEPVGELARELILRQDR